jgi:hypothetical protein
MSTNGHAVLGIDVGEKKRHRREVNCAAICALLPEQAPISTPISSTPPQCRGKASAVVQLRPHVRRAADGARRRQHSPHGRHIASIGRKAAARGRQYRAVAPMN